MLVMNGAEEAAPAPFPNASLHLELPFLGGSNHEDIGRPNSHSRHCHCLVVTPGSEIQLAKPPSITIDWW